TGAGRRSWATGQPLSVGTERYRVHGGIESLQAFQFPPIGRVPNQDDWLLAAASHRPPVRADRLAPRHRTPAGPLSALSARILSPEPNRPVHRGGCDVLVRATPSNRPNVLLVTRQAKQFR